MAKKMAAKKPVAKKQDAVASATMREVIVQAIEESGKSVRAVALNAGISQPSLSRFVNGERDLLLDAADKVAKSLGLKLVKDVSVG
jgi:plasmid maintenance system antidote protein VapI